LNKKIFALIMTVFLAGSVSAQNAFDYLKDSLINVLTVSTLMQVTDYEYNGQNAIWGTYLEPGKSISLSAQYDAGIEYLMLASAHTENREIHLKVYNGQGTRGTVIAKDTAPDAAPVVRFKPVAAGWHTFELRNVSNQPSFVSLVVLKNKRNANFSFDTLVEALSNTLTISQHIAQLIPDGSEIPANKWTLFGGSVRQNGNAGYYNTQLSRGNYILVGAAENSVKNCDVEVIEQYNSGNTEGRYISQNTGSEYPFDFAAFSSGSSSKYHFIKVNNQNSLNPGSLLFGFLIMAK